MSKLRDQIHRQIGTTGHLVTLTEEQYAAICDYAIGRIRQIAGGGPIREDGQGAAPVRHLPRTFALTAPRSADSSRVTPAGQFMGDGSTREGELSIASGTPQPLLTSPTLSSVPASGDGETRTGPDVREIARCRCGIEIQWDDHWGYVAPSWEPTDPSTDSRWCVESVDEEHRPQ